MTSPPQIGRCPAAWELTRAVSEAPPPDLERHLALCRRCASEYRALQRLRQQVAALPQRGMSLDSRRAILDGMAAAPPARGRRGTRVTVAAVVAAAVVVLVAGGVMRQRGPSAPIVGSPASAAHASIRSAGDARFSRLHPPPDEVVRLDEGTITLDVTPLALGERFRVVTADAQVEVRGTRFAVTASNGQLLSVNVSSGHVVVTPSWGAVVSLHSGESWTRGARAAAATAGIEPAPPSSGRPAMVSTAPARGARRIPRERITFDHAWALLREGDLNGAAAAFDELARVERGRSIEEDARYWKAVALARAKRSEAASDAFSEFIARFPGSARAGEASAMLGWLLVDAGDSDGARAAFTRCLNDRSDSVRASARQGLARLRAQ